MLRQGPFNWLKPKNDFVLKWILGSDNDQSKELLLAFLNDFLYAPALQSFTSVEIVNPIINKQSIYDKGSILDIKAKVPGYGYVNIEMQLTNQKNMHKRSLYYASKLIGNQLFASDGYSKLERVVAINLLDFSFFPSTPYHSCFRLVEERLHEPFPDLLQLHFTEMPKFVRQDQAGKIPMNDRKAKWLRFFTNEDDTRWFEMAKQDPVMEQMVESLRVASLDPEARELYEARAKALMDLNSIRGEARQEGIEEGIKEGIKEGLKKGIKEGLKKGRKEGKREANRELAKKMLRKGFEVSDIIEMTELTETEIEKLMVEINNH